MLAKIQGDESYNILVVGQDVNLCNKFEKEFNIFQWVWTNTNTRAYQFHSYNPNETWI